MEAPTNLSIVPFRVLLQLGSIVALDKALVKIDEQKKKKLEEAFLAVARAGKPGKAAAPPPIAVKNPSSKNLAAGSVSCKAQASQRTWHKSSKHVLATDASFLHFVTSVCSMYDTCRCK